MDTLPIYETFHTWQGEGAHLGRAAFFIRTFGCPVHCPWCDSAGTWHPDFVPEDIERADVETLADKAAATAAEFVVITGGEPAIHDLGPLTAALTKRNLPAHLETSGAFPLRGDFAWVTLSPKRWKEPLTETLARADEFKIIVEDAGSIAFWEEKIGAHYGSKPVWLHPEWSQRDNPAVLSAITETVKTKGTPYRAGWQLHKLYKADEADPASRRNVPLGGDPGKGF